MSSAWIDAFRCLLSGRGFYIDADSPAKELNWGWCGSLGYILSSSYLLLLALSLSLSLSADSYIHFRFDWMTWKLDNKRPDAYYRPVRDTRITYTIYRIDCVCITARAVNMVSYQVSQWLAAAPACICHPHNMSSDESSAAVCSLWRRRNNSQDLTRQNIKNVNLFLLFLDAILF